MQESYKSPKLSVILLETEDIMSTSLTNGGEDGDAGATFSLGDLTN